MRGISSNCPTDLIGVYFDARGINPAEDYCEFCDRRLDDGGGCYCEWCDVTLCEGCYELHMEEEHGGEEDE